MAPGQLKQLGKRLTDAAARAGFRGGSAQKETAAKDALENIGVVGVGISSDDEEIENFERKLWESQDDFVDELAREWKRILDYVSSRQHIAWNSDVKRWVPKKTVPWRVRAIYNVMQKAVDIRTSRLTENKPSISVIAGSTERGDVDAAEYKESLFWALWNQLDLHMKVVRGRRWATKCDSGFLKVTYNAEAGCEYPATKKRLKFEQRPKLDPRDPTGQTPMLDQFNQPVMEKHFVGVEEYYVDQRDNDLGPVYNEVPDDEDPRGGTKKVKNDPPQGVLWLFEGWPDVTVRSPFAVRWDRYTDDLPDSWYIQDSEIMAGTAVLAQGWDLEKIREAKAASDDEKALHWNGLRSSSMDRSSSSSTAQGDNDEQLLDKEFLVRETWIFPKNQMVRDLWGRKGCKIITVGGKLVQKDPLPEWALETCNFIQLIDTPEEGNHYGKTRIRDILPIQDDINRTRSHMAEREAIQSRLILHSVQGHQMNLKLLGGLPAVLLTTRGQEHKPTPLQMSTGDTGAERFYESSLQAAEDLGNMNPASTGKLPSAGLPAKAIYALQYADERSIAETSTLQDVALKRLAQSLDAVCRHEWDEARKIRIVGDDRSFMIEKEITPEHLSANVDYFFVPGSMMSRQKEAVKNEMLQLMEVGLIQPWEVRKYIGAAVPEAFRRSYNLPESKARRNLELILSQAVTEIQPDPWEDPDIATGVLEEFMLTRKWELLGEGPKAAVTQLWQAYQLMRQKRMAAAQPQTQPAPGGGAAGAGGAAKTPTAAQGAAQLENAATSAMEQDEPPNAEPQQ
jgi:hypothetical protein